MSGLVDAHHHLWDPDAVSYSLFDAYPRLAPLARQGSLAAYDAVARAHRISGAVCVEVASAGADGPAETAWLATQIRSSPLPRSLVAWAPVEDAAIDAWLGRLSSMSVLVSGVRRFLESVPDGFISSPAMIDGLRQVGRKGMVFDLVMFGPRIREAIEVARRLPEVTFVLDHLGKPTMERAALRTWSHDIAGLARLPNVMAKVSGLLTEGPQGPEIEFAVRTMIATAIDLFGPTRLMFGTDWPVCELAEGGVSRWVGLVEGALVHLDRDERRAITETTAMHTYFNDAPSQPSD